MNRRNLIRMAIISPLILICLCVALSVFSSKNGDGGSAEVSSGSSSSGPTRTLRPSPPFQDIADNYDEMTDAQWEKYSRDELVGTLVSDWTGTVGEVDKGELSGNYTIYVTMPGRFLPEAFIDVNEKTALELRKNQEITFSGKIKGATNSFGLYINIVNATIK